MLLHFDLQKARDMLRPRRGPQLKGLIIEVTAGFWFQVINATQMVESMIEYLASIAIAHT